ncbi:nitrous oxide-stimulated promoter family protein [Vibrio algicola]|uniref:Nitrous oxide-stimulated promoter family protein n=1 Tax=Vibrio algicola TaxID=2662262 RepID=A0A5Q0TGX8_9VIBR|nr:nitrous oxide-stimulated promoter family protein [Vibrio algicola]
MKKTLSNSELLIGSLQTEYKTLQAMIGIYCPAHHATNLGDKNHQGLCQECQSLLDYAEMRLDRCPYGETKPTCNKCPIHCYKPEPKAQMREVMIYAGPRMLMPHPILAIRHLIKERKKAAGKPAANQSNRAKRKANYERSGNN